MVAETSISCKSGPNGNVQNVNEMPQLTRGRLSILASGSHVDNRSAINIKACQNAVRTQMTSDKNVFFLIVRTHRRAPEGRKECYEGW